MPAESIVPIISTAGRNGTGLKKNQVKRVANTVKHCDLKSRATHSLKPGGKPPTKHKK